jgi:hypothetical protein
MSGLLSRRIVVMAALLLTAALAVVVAGVVSHPATMYSANLATEGS